MGGGEIRTGLYFLDHRLRLRTDMTPAGRICRSGTDDMFFALKLFDRFQGDGPEVAGIEVFREEVLGGEELLKSLIGSIRSPIYRNKGEMENGIHNRRGNERG